MARKLATKCTQVLVLETLEQMKIEYELGNDNKFIGFHYRGENYCVYADNRSAFIAIWIFGLMSVDIDDLDEVNRMRKVINEANQESNVTFLFHVDKEEETIHVHCKRVIPFMKEITELDDYLKTVLHEISRAHKFFDCKMTKLREEGRGAETDEQDYGTRRLFIKTLTKIGCPYEVDENNSIVFFYEGGEFIANAEDNHKYVNLLYPSFCRVDYEDVPAVSRLRKAINNTNIEREVITAYGIDKENKEMFASSHLAILFGREIPNLEMYLRTELQEFFYARHYLDAELFKLEAMEAAEEK